MGLGLGVLISILSLTLTLTEKTACSVNVVVPSSKVSGTCSPRPLGKVRPVAMSAPVTAVVTKLSPGAASGLSSTAQIGSQSTRLHSPRRLPYAIGGVGTLSCRNAAARRVRQMRLVLAMKRGERWRTALPSAPRPWLNSIVYLVGSGPARL